MARTPTGAAVLQPAVTEAVTAAVLDELAEHGYARLSMEAVARRAGVGKSALYRRWPSRQEMALAVVSQLSVDLAAAPDTGSLRGDVRASLDAVLGWLGHPHMSRILPDLVAETARHPELADVVTSLIGTPRRDRVAVVLHRAIDRGELPAGTDLEIALDVLAAPLYWRLVVRFQEVDEAYLDRLADVITRALSG